MGSTYINPFVPVDCNCQFNPENPSLKPDGRTYHLHTTGHAEDCPAHKRIVLLNQGEQNVFTKVKKLKEEWDHQEQKEIETTASRFSKDIKLPKFNPAVEDALEAEGTTVSLTELTDAYKDMLSQSITPLKLTETFKSYEQYLKHERDTMTQVDALPLDHPEVKAMERIDVQRFKTGAVRGTDANDKRFDLIPQIGLRRLAETCADGAKKYGVDNWRKGFPVSDVMSHALTHLHLWLTGDVSEDHLAHARWNLFVVQEFEETRQELMDVASRKKD